MLSSGGGAGIVEVAPLYPAHVEQLMTQLGRVSPSERPGWRMGINMLSVRLEWDDG